jgi:hypothetical protein
MKQLSDEVARLVPVLSAIHKLIKDEETKTTARLPTLIAAFNTPYDRPASDSPAEIGLEDRRRDPSPNSHTGRPSMVKSLWKKLIAKDRAYSLENQSGSTDIMPISPAIGGDNLSPENGLTVGDVMQNKVEGGTEGMPCALAGCHAELDSLLDRIKSKDGGTSRKKALAWTFRQGEVRKTLDNLQRFHQLLTSALLVDQTYVPGLASTIEHLLMFLQ